MKFSFACFLVFVALHTPAYAQSPVAGQALPTSESAENGTVFRHLGDGYAALLANDLAAAEKHFLTVLRLEPKNIWGTLNMGVVLHRQSNFAEARSNYTEVLTQDNKKERAALASLPAFSKAFPSEIAQANLDLLERKQKAAQQKCLPSVDGPFMRLASETPAAGCPALIADIRFVFNKAVPTPEGQAFLDTLPEKLKQVSSLHVRGYTDDQGSAALNNPLARKRAAYVANWLVKQGVRVTSQSSYSLCCYRIAKPSLNARQTNRRVEIEFTQE